jgi:hypothetical protein
MPHRVQHAYGWFERRAGVDVHDTTRRVTRRVGRGDAGTDGVTHHDRRVETGLAHGSTDGLDHLGHAVRRGLAGLAVAGQVERHDLTIEVDGA